MTARTKRGKRRLVLIRHAHRDTSDRAADNGLSEKGWIQARRVLEYFGRRFPDAGASTGRIRVVSSPKTRCRETVAPIAQAAGLELEIDPLLDEQAAQEAASEMRHRAEKFIDRWLRSSASDAEITIVCSHGDWLPAALRAATRARIELKKGGWAELADLGKGERPELVFVIQSFKNLM